MTLGVEVRSRTSPPARGAPTDTGTLFVPAKLNSGPLDAVTEVRSTNDLVASYGDRDATGNATTFDSLDTYFREGGRRALVARYTDAGTIDSALTLFDKKKGPGQIVAWDETPGPVTYGKLWDHSEQNNRFALGDVGNGDTVAAMDTLGDAIVALPNTSFGMGVGPWTNIPGPAGVIGAGERQVPGSATAAALIARVDALGNPNRAAAGRDFPLQYVRSFVRNISDADREALIAKGINTFAEVYGVLELYGFQTGRPQNPDDPYWQANCGRARMWLTARAQSAGEGYMFKPIDGRGRLARRLKTDLDAIHLELYNMDGLFGATPQEAFSTEVGAAVNRIDTIAQGELHGVSEAVLALHAKAVYIDLVSVALGNPVTRAAS